MYFRYALLAMRVYSTRLPMLAVTSKTVLTHAVSCGVRPMYSVPLHVTSGETR